MLQITQSYYNGVAQQSQENLGTFPQNIS